MPDIMLTINGQPVTVPRGTTVLEAARELGFDIPTFCHDPELTRYGGCRICVVEVAGGGQLPASCVTEARDGMEIYTESDRVLEARRTILELLLANHPDDCLSCEKSGACRLQDYAYRYGVRKGNFLGAAQAHPLEEDNPFILRDMNKCILCGKCVRVCSEVVGRNAVDFAYRGFNAKVAAPLDCGLRDSSCIFCGSCVELCPVGALTEKQMRGKGRKWELTPVTTTCPYCGVGCQINLQVNRGKVVGVKSAGSGINGRHLCVKGRFAHGFIHHPERLTTPLIRKGGQLQEASWPEALEEAARRLKQIRRNFGSEAIGILASARITNEENYLLNKLARAALGTNNLDHCARL